MIKRTGFEGKPCPIASRESTARPKYRPNRNILSFIVVLPSIVFFCANVLEKERTVFGPRSIGSPTTLPHSVHGPSYTLTRFRPRISVRANYSTVARWLSRQ